MALVDEPVRGLVPFVDGVGDELVGLRLETDDLDDLLHPPDQVVADPDLGLDEHVAQGGEQYPGTVDGRVLQPVDHRFDRIGVHGASRCVWPVAMAWNMM